MSRTLIRSRTLLLASVSLATLAAAQTVRAKPLAEMVTATHAPQTAVASAAASGAPLPVSTLAQAAAQQARTSANLAEAATRIRAALAAQATARAAAAGTPASGPQGLAPGALVVDPRVTNPNAPGYNPGLYWIGANAPVQALANGQTTVTIAQTQAQAILNWQTFNVGAATSVDFVQQNASGVAQTSWVALNRVNDPGANPTQILGQIKAPGQIYILNRNGIIFGGTSQVNTGALVAAAANLTDAQFTANGLFSPSSIEFNGKIGSYTAYTPAFTDAGGAVDVMPGAQITTNTPTAVTAGGGFVLLMGQAVTNNGQIITPQGQTALAAGDNFSIRPGFSVGQAATGATTGNLTSTTRGLEIAPQFASDSGAGAVTNAGYIYADQGDITLTGQNVVQGGVALSSTSVTQRGTIHLLSSSSDPDSSVTLTPDSLTLIQPEDSSATALDSQRAAEIAQSATEDYARFQNRLVEAQQPGLQFDNYALLDDLQDESRVEIVTGGGANFSGGSLAMAQGGQIAVSATGRVSVATGANLDVSGSLDALLPMSANQLLVNVQGNEQRDDPLNRLTTDLNNLNIYVDIGDLSEIAASSSYDQTRYYTSGGVLEVSGYLANTGHTIAEWTAVGGSISLNAAQVVSQSGSTFNIAGGAVGYQGGYLRETYLRASNGSIYSIDNAPADLVYTGLADSFQVNHSRWVVTQSYSAGLLGGDAIYKPGYVVGRDAGSLTLNAPTSIFDGVIDAGVVQGVAQNAARPATVSDAYTLAQTVVAEPGALDLLYNVEGQIDPVMTDITFSADAQSLADMLTPTTAVPKSRIGTSDFDAAALSAAGLGSLNIETDGSVTISSPLTLANGAAISVYSASLDINANLTARSGSLIAANFLSSQTFGVTNPKTGVTVTGSIQLGPGASVDLQGVWTNLALDPQSGADSAFINGGAVTLTSLKNVTLSLGSLIDTSSGAQFNANRTETGGSGGDISLTADAAVGTIPSGGLTLDGELRSVGVVKGGTLSLSGTTYIVADAPPTNANFRGTWLRPDFFDQGFSAYDLISSKNFIVKQGTVVDVAEPTYQFTVDDAFIATGADPASALTAELVPVYTANPLTGTVIRRPGASLSVIGIQPTVPTTFLPRIVVGGGAAISLDPGQTLHLETFGQLTIRGALTAPGGRIDLLSDSTAVDPTDNGTGALSIWLGSKSLVDVAGRAFAATDALGRPFGVAPAGGVINIASNGYGAASGNGLLATTDAFVIIRPGAVIDASGSATLISPYAGQADPAGLSGGGLAPVLAQGAGGTIAISSQSNFYLDGTLLAAAGGPQAAGGTLSLGLDFNGSSSFEDQPRVLTIDAVVDGSQLPTTLHAGVYNPALSIGNARLGLNQISDGGFGTVSLFARDAILFNGNLTLSASQAIDILQGPISDTSASASVTISAPHVVLGGQTTAQVGQYAVEFALANYSKQATTGDLTIDASLLDVENAVRFGASGQITNADGSTTPVDYAGFANVNLISQGDLRFLPATDGTIDTVLTATGNLNLTAGQIYVTGNVGLDDNALVRAGYNPYPTAQTGEFFTGTALDIHRYSDVTPTAPLTLGGTLDFQALTINQGGVIVQPLGRITLGELANGLEPAGTPNGTVNFLPGSVTSVSAVGLSIPYGGTTDGVTYDVNGLPVQARALSSNGIGLPGVTNGISPGTITILGLVTNVETGATIDLRGGGSLTGEGFISGEGGSTDVLTTPLLHVASSGVVTQPSLASDPVYAIVAGTQALTTPLQSFTESGAAELAPALGEQINVPAGVPGLPAGTYTLLPAAYALVPGGYRVEFDGAAKLSAPAVTALTNGSYTVSGYTGEANTTVVSTLPTALTVTPAATVRTYAQYDEESYSDFLTTTAASIGAVRPILPIDAGTLVLQFPALNSAVLKDTGTTLTTPAAGGQGATVQVSGTPFVAMSPTFDIYGATPTAGLPAGTVSISAAALDDFSPFTLEIGVGGEGFNANVQGITVESGATLTAGRVLLTALKYGITLASGSKIDTLGKASLLLDSTQTGPLTDGGATVLDVANGFITYASDTEGGFGAYGPITVADGATIYTAGSIAFSTQASVNFGLTAIYGGKYLDLAAQDIDIGDPAAVGATSPPALTLTSSVLSRLTAGDPAIGLPGAQTLILAASQSLNFFGTTSLDLSGADVELVVDAPAIYGYGSAGDVASVSAKTIVWNGFLAPGMGQGVTPVSGLPGGVTANGAGTGSGTLDFNAGTIVLGYSDLDAPIRNVPLDRLTLGFSTVNFNATSEITANNQGALAVYETQPAVYGQAGTGGILNLNTPLLTTASGATIGFTAGSALSVSTPAGQSPATALPAQAAGGEIDLAGAMVVIDAAVILPSGKLDVQSTGDISLGASSLISLAGQTSQIISKTTYGFGGDLILASAQSNVSQASGSVIDVSAVNNAAGSIQITAAGQVSLGGSLVGGSTSGYASGQFVVSAQGVGDFDALNAALTTGGFFQKRSFDIKQGDLTIDGGVTAHEIDVSLDGGSLTVDGLIDASGGGGGIIDLAASNNLTLTGAAVLDAQGKTLVLDGYGQVIAADNSPSVSLTTTTGQLTLSSGASIDVASPDGVSRGDIELNVPRLVSATYGDANISAAKGLNITGAASVAVNAFWSYNGLADPNQTVDGASDALITQAYLDQINTSDSQPFMAAAANNSDLANRLAGLSGPNFHFRPGVEIVSATPTGDLTVQGDIDLSGYRYGPGVNPNVYGSGEPGVLLIRAGGNLNIYGSITDGFAPPIDDAGTAYANGWVLFNGSQPYGDTVLPTSVTIAAGSGFGDSEPVNYAVPITGGDFSANAIAPTALTLTQPSTVSVTFVATSAITLGTGAQAKVLFNAGQVVPQGVVLPKGATINPGGILPFDVVVGPVLWPANTPFTVTTSVNSVDGSFEGVKLSEPLTLLAGSLIPSDSVLKLPEGDDGNGSAPLFVQLRPLGGDGSQGQLWALGSLLPTGDLSWSLQLVAGADAKAANTGAVQTSDSLAAEGDEGTVVLADSHYGVFSTTKPGKYSVPAFSVVRTGTGSLDLIAGGSIDEVSSFGVYTAGAQAAPILNANGQNPYNLAQGGEASDGTLLGAKYADLAALDADYQANYATGGGNVLVSAQKDLNGYIFTGDQPDLAALVTTDAIGGWLWRQGGAGQPGAWWINFGSLALYPGGIGPPELTGFQGIGTLGGGNLTVEVGGNASRINLVVASTGRVLADGSLAETGGGDLSLSVGEIVNPVNPYATFVTAYLDGDDGGLVSDLRGTTSLEAAEIGLTTPQPGSTANGDPRVLPPLESESADVSQGIDLAPGDGTVSVTTRADLAIDGVANPGTVQNLVNSTPISITLNGKTTNYAGGATSSFSLWSPRTAISLLSAGGDVTPTQDDRFVSSTQNAESDIFSGINYYPQILTVTAENGNIYTLGGTVELAPAAAGQLELLAAGSILGGANTYSTATFSVSGAQPDTEATPFNPGLVVSTDKGGAVYTNASTDSGSTLFNFGPDTPSSALHAGDPNPALIYANTDIVDVEFGSVSSSSGELSGLFYAAAKPFYVIAGRDIVNSGSPDEPDVFLNLAPGDVTVFKAGRDILQSSADIVGPGTLSVEAGRNLTQLDNGDFVSLGAAYDVNSSNFAAGANIAVTVGAGFDGPDYAAFAGLYLNPANQANPAYPLDFPQNKGKVVQTYQDQLFAWLKLTFGYTGSEGDQMAFFGALTSEQQAVFLRTAYYNELAQADISYNTPTDPLYRSYVRGRTAIATLLPSVDSAGQPIAYGGDVTMYGGSGVHTEFGGDVQLLVPGGQAIIGVNGLNPPSTAGLLTQGTGDIDIYSLGSVLLGQSRIFTTFGGQILIWSADGDINAGRGAKTTVVYNPPRLAYDNYGNITLSPSVPTSGAGIATLAPIPSVPPGNIYLVAPNGTIDAGEAGIRVSGNAYIAALHLVNADNIQVTGKAFGLPPKPTTDFNLTIASTAATEAAQVVKQLADNARRQQESFVYSVEVIGFGAASDCDGKAKSRCPPDGQSN